jgi:hypothetical protein
LRATLIEMKLAPLDFVFLAAPVAASAQANPKRQLRLRQETTLPFDTPLPSVTARFERRSRVLTDGSGGKLVS